VPAGGSWFSVVEIFVVAAIGIAVLAFAAQGRIFRKNNVLETAFLLVAGLFLVLPSVVDAITSAAAGATVPYKALIGTAITAAIVAWQWTTTSREVAAASAAQR
jgi:TRAP-type uncharacterized transport system fused permease subunit